VDRDVTKRFDEIYLSWTTQTREEFYAEHREELNMILGSRSAAAELVSETSAIISGLELLFSSAESQIRWAAVYVAKIVCEGRGTPSGINLIAAADNCRLAARDQDEELDWQRQYLIESLLE